MTFLKKKKNEIKINLRVLPQNKWDTPINKIAEDGNNCTMFIKF